MPLLRRKPFTPDKPPPNLKGDDEVFFCELTGEIYVDYEVFYQRMILCNSLVWSCECTGKPNLTFKEAKDSEENVKKSLAAFPDPLKRAVLSLVHHTRRSKIQDLLDEIYDYLKNRYQVNEDVEIKIKDKWVTATVISVPDKSNIGLLRSPQKSLSPLKSPNKDKENSQQNRSKIKSPLGQKSQWPDAGAAEYKVRLAKKSKFGDFLTVKGKAIRRLKGVFIKDRVKLYIRQTCSRSTVSTDDGYWIVCPTAIETFSLGPSSIAGNIKDKKKTDKNRTKEGKSKGSDKDRSRNKEKDKDKKSKSKPMTLEEKRKQYLQEKEREKQSKLLEIETARIKKLQEKEEEKARKRDEREKERELSNEVKKFEIDFTKEFTKVKEDLRLEDLKPLATLVPLKLALDQDLIGDALMVVEFVNIFGSLFDLKEQIDSKITLEWIEEALTEYDAEGKYYQILRFLLHSYLKFEQDEKIHANDDDEGSSSDDDDESKEQTQQVNGEDGQTTNGKKPSTNAKAAAAWPMLSQGLALHEITIEPFSLTEVLRLHILSSGVRFGAITNWKEWQHRGLFQLCDDPCVAFRHNETDIMRKMMTGSLYDLSAGEKLKILVLMCDQMLTLCTVRDYMEEAQDKSKALRKKLREVQFEENKRRKTVAKEKWKKKIAERTKQKEESQNLKKDKQEQIEKGEKPEIKQADEKKGNEEETPEQVEEKLKRKEAKEAKEQQLEHFHRDKFLFSERQILNEMAKHNAAFNQTPLGRDRIFRKYWKFSSIDGLFVENDDDGAQLLLDLNRHEKEDRDFSSEDEAMQDEETPNSESKPVSAPKVVFEEIVKARETGKPLEELLMKRYKCEYSSNISEIIERSTVLRSCLDDVRNGVDPLIYAVTDRTKWSSIASQEQFLAVLDSLNNRGLREQTLLSNFNNEKSQIVDYFLDHEKDEEKNTNKKARALLQPVTRKPAKDANQIDKSLFQSMEDFVEASLRDQLLELEERVWFASLGNSTMEDRERWRFTVESRISKLISTDNGENNTDSVTDVLKTEKSIENSDITNVNGDAELNNEVIQNGEHKAPLPMDIVIPAVKALPLHLKDSIKDEKDRSRCSTPVDDNPESEKIIFVKELSEALIELERALTKKYLKPPLGETEETKKERLKGLIESSSKVNGETPDEEKKSSSLTRWEESLTKCSSLSQVFIHLNTLDRSIMWDKSIQNVRCRVCRRKGNDDEMLLCDGCDRGFHMSCLTPPLKNVPVGDWFCKDCKPVEVRRRRKHSKAVEETEDDETEEEEDTEEEEEDEEEESEEESVEESEEDEEEDEDDSGSEHGERCTVCDGDGTLILCEGCPRSYHVECCYPPLKKVPRGAWICQICRGTDTDLPYRKRAATIEKKREKEEKSKTQESKLSRKGGQRGNQKNAQQQRGMPSAPVKRSQKSPSASGPAKKARIENEADDSHSQREKAGFGRKQLKCCTTLLNEVMKKEEAEVFRAPVDPKEVPDYLDFVDNPMDFGTIKRKLNNAKYIEVTQFLDDIQLVFTNCETYNPPRSQVAREGNKLKTFIKKKIKELKLE